VFPKKEGALLDQKSGAFWYSGKEERGPTLMRPFSSPSLFHVVFPFYFAPSPHFWLAKTGSPIRGRKEGGKTQNKN